MKVAAVPLKEARNRSLVRFDAYIQLVDLKIMREVWQSAAQALKQQVAQQATKSGRANRTERRTQLQQSSSNEELGLALLKDLPHLLHMTFLTAPEEEVALMLWAAIRPEYLSLSSEDLLMKYGPSIDGAWTVVGIINGLSRPGPPPTMSVNPLIDGVVTAMLGVRELIGRPRNHWGITPIAIYGPVLGIAETEAMDALDKAGNNEIDQAVSQEDSQMPTSQ